MELLEFKKELSKHIVDGKLDTFGTILLLMFSLSLGSYLVRNWKTLVKQYKKGE